MKNKKKRRERRRREKERKRKMSMSTGYVVWEPNTQSCYNALSKIFNFQHNIKKVMKRSKSVYPIYQ
jgi:hypothetical protein